MWILNKKYLYIINATQQFLQTLEEVHLNDYQELGNQCLK